MRSLSGPDDVVVADAALACLVLPDNLPAAVRAPPEAAPMRHIHAPGPGTDALELGPRPPPQFDMCCWDQSAERLTAQPQVQAEQFVTVNLAEHRKGRREAALGRVCNRLAHSGSPRPAWLDFEDPGCTQHIRAMAIQTHFNSAIYLQGELIPIPVVVPRRLRCLARRWSRAGPGPEAQ